MKKHKITEAKKPSYEKKLAEIEKQGKMVTVEAKIDALAEMIEAKTQRLTLVNEDENLAELIDKKKLKEMQKEIKLLEKTKAKMEKLYEKMGGTRTEVTSGDTVDSEVEENIVGEDVDLPNDEKVEADISDDIAEDSVSEDFDLKGYLAENKLLKEFLYLDIHGDQVTLNSTSGGYDGFIESDNTINFSVVYDNEDDRNGMEFSEHNWKDILGPNHAFVRIANQIPTKVEALDDYVMISVDLEDLKGILSTTTPYIK
jgi:hypothetical protein